LRASSRHLVRTICIWTALILTLLLLAACGDSPDETAPIDYSPLPGAGWEVASPGDQTLDPELVDALYREATEQDTLYSLLVVKDGVLIAEGYFNGGSAEQKTLIQSASKSYISALVGIAIEQGCLSSVDQTMIDFFPEIAGRISDPRKRGITIRQMLQMRAGYPDEETDSAFAQAHLFEPTGTEVGDWLQDREGNYIGSGGIHVTPRDAAVFGQLYLDRGVYDGEQVVPAEWVGQSLRSYSERARSYGRSLTFRDLGYGYGWWTARAGEHNVVFGWGHGGQLIALVDELDIVIVTTADPFFGQHDGDSWKHEKAILNMVGDFIESLPAGR
jgi:CubicO group peptidase (beta-lactamase class C family)